MRESAEAPSVVVLCGNDIAVDNRVRKSALSLARLGLRVTVLAYAPDGVRTESNIGPVAVIRVPVNWAHRDASKESSSADASWRRARADARERDIRRSQQEAALRRQWAGQDSQRLRRAWWGLRGQVAAHRLSRHSASAEGVGPDAGWLRRFRPTSLVSDAGVAIDYELAYAPELEALHPDLVHVHDVELLLVAQRARARAARRGEDLPFVYDAHEYVAGMRPSGGRSARMLKALRRLEADTIRDAAGVVTVSDEIAALLQQDHLLDRRPTTMLNCPPSVWTREGDDPRLREVLGLQADVPLMVYAGSVGGDRGVDCAVAALPHLPGVHLAVVATPSADARGARLLRSQAAGLGLSDRLSILDPVPGHRLVDYLRGCDIALLTLPRLDDQGQPIANHGLAVPNKLFDAWHAGLAVVASNCAAQEALVLREGLGTSYEAEDPVALAAAVQAVLAEPRGARRSPPTWEDQEQALTDLYRSLIELPQGAGVPLNERERWPLPARTATAPALAIGPTNSAGQGAAWAAAVRAVHGIETHVIAIRNGGFDYPADVVVQPQVFARDGRWQARLREEGLKAWTHVLIEAGRPIFGTRNGSDFRGDAAELHEAGVAVGLVFHGSEVRSPALHAASHPVTPFLPDTEAAAEYVALLQRKCDALLPLVAGFAGPKFVSTLDLLDYVPDATWLPVTVERESLPLPRSLLSTPTPVVVHAPSNRLLKGSDIVDAVLSPLAASGRIDYRRVEGVTPDVAARALADADIVVDQLMLGLYGHLACQSMALGRCVVGNLGETLRERSPAPVPVVEAEPDSLADVMLDLIEDPERIRAAGVAGMDFVAEYHDGSTAAAALAPFLGLSPTESGQV